MGDVPDGQTSDPQHLGGAVHADGGEVLAEGRVADLGVGALELPAARGDPPRDVVQAQIGRELALDDGRGLLEERCAMPNCRWTLHGEVDF
jgi:hypothetical protein